MGGCGLLLNTGTHRNNSLANGSAVQLACLAWCAICSSVGTIGKRIQAVVGGIVGASRQGVVGFGLGKAFKVQALRIGPIMHTPSRFLHEGCANVTRWVATNTMAC